MWIINVMPVILHYHLCPKIWCLFHMTVDRKFRIFLKNPTWVLLTMLFRWESEVLSLLRLRLLPLLRSARLSPRSVINVMRVLSLLSGWLYKAALCSDLMFESGGQHLSNISAKSAYHHTIKKTMPVNILYHVCLSKAALINMRSSFGVDFM